MGIGKFLGRLATAASAAHGTEHRTPGSGHKALIHTFKRHLPQTVNKFPEALFKVSALLRRFCPESRCLVRVLLQPLGYPFRGG